MEFAALAKEIENFLPQVTKYRDDATAARIVALAATHYAILTGIAESTDPISPAVKTEAFSNYIEFHQIVIEYINKKTGE
ncbi:MAG: hypothetical protein RSD49_21670 [Hafnia sp.]